MCVCLNTVSQCLLFSLTHRKQALKKCNNRLKNLLNESSNVYIYICVCVCICVCACVCVYILCWIDIRKKIFASAFSHS